jgi:RNA polymerase sigma-70 factor (ECF subfamily)
MSDLDSYTTDEGSSRPGDEEQEEALLGRAVEGDSEAFGALYERYVRALYRYFFARVGDMHIAEDLTETLFLKVWESMPRFQVGRVLFRTWLYRIAHNLVVDHYRTRKHHAELGEHLHLRNGSPLPEEEMLLDERRQRFVEVVKGLKPEHQQILILRFVNGMSHKEAAEVLGRRPGAVRALQYRALQALEEALRQQGEGR